MWLLHSRPDYERPRAVARGLRVERRRGTRTDERQHLPLRRVPQHRACGAARAQTGAANVKDFDYVQAKSLSEATAQGAGAHARYIAGGTLLVDLMRLNVERPDLVVDLGAALSSEIRV